MTERLVIGCMTGTSLDALDAAAIRITGHGLSMGVTFVAEQSASLDTVAPRLRRMSTGAPFTARDIAQLSLDFGELHAAALAELIREVGRPDLIAVHGQTVLHAPPLSWQLINPWPIARTAGCPIVTDLRGADLALAGQGAPITPLADWILFRDPHAPRAIVNLGGFCNITLLPAGNTPQDIRGLDVCACNHLLDAVARAALNRPFDADGNAASKGAPLSAAVDELVESLSAQHRSGRSLGTGDETFAWIERWARTLSPNDAAASVSTGVARAIASAIPPGAEVLCAGGSVRHRHLMHALAASLGRPIDTTARCGIPPSARESVEMGVLGALCADGVPITLPAVTGVSAPAPISGAWFNLRGIHRPQSMTHP